MNAATKELRTYIFEHFVSGFFDIADSEKYTKFLEEIAKQEDIKLNGFEETAVRVVDVIHFLVAKWLLSFDLENLKGHSEEAEKYGQIIIVLGALLAEDLPEQWK